MIVKEDGNKSNHPIQNHSLLVTEHRTRDILMSDVVTIINTLIVYKEPMEIFEICKTYM
jgi:hypothetical protein